MQFRMKTLPVTSRLKHFIIIVKSKDSIGRTKFIKKKLWGKVWNNEYTQTVFVLRPLVNSVGQ